MNSHRKILEIPANTTEICTIRCDPLKNSLNCTANCNTTADAASAPPWPSLPLPPPFTDVDFYPTSAKHHHSSLSLTLKISIVILVLTFSFFLLYTLYKFYTVWYRSRRRRPPPPETPSPENQETETNNAFLDQDVLDHPIWYIRTIGLQPSVISAITVVKYSKTDGLIDGSDCSVCLSDFQEDETLRLLPKCNHAFHISCIDTWLRSHTNCPLCRAGIVKNGSNSSSSGQNLDDLGQIEEPQVAIGITEEGNQEQIETEDGNQNSSDLTTGIGIGSGDLMIMRRSVSLNDYAGCRNRSDVSGNNNYYSDRHEVQIRSIDGDLGGFQLVKVDRTVNN